MGDQTWRRDDARSAAKARYFERWGRAIEADGQSAFVAAAKERALVWITDQRARVADELRHRPNTPLSEFDNLDAWVTDGLELWFRAAEDRVTLAALVESLKIEKRGRLEWEEFGCLAVDDEWLDDVDFAEIYDSDFGRPFTNPFSITQWRAQPPWQLVRAFVELGRAVEQGRTVLRDLAANPATAMHVASKLARHFIADTPPPALVERMT